MPASISKTNPTLSQARTIAPAASAKTEACRISWSDLELMIGYDWSEQHFKHSANRNIWLASFRPQQIFKHNQAVPNDSNDLG